MLPQKQAEEAIVPNISEADHEGKEEKEEDDSFFSIKNALWHGGSAWDAWFSCASNQVKTQTLSEKRDSVCSFFQLVFQALENNFFFIFYCGYLLIAGGTSAVNTALLLLPAGYALGDHIPDILWPRGKLDSLPHQCSLHRVSKSEGEGEC